MTNEEKKRIIELRKEGKGYGEISKLTGLSKNSVSTFLRREGEKKGGCCPVCGKRLIQTPGHRQKVFCSERCRTLSWMGLGKKGIGGARFTCKCCGKEFRGYESQHPSFCSRECYYAFRRGKGNGAD